MSAAFRPVQSESPIVLRFDARGIARRFRHAAALAALATLRSGETMRFVSDDDAESLLDEVAQRHRNGVLVRIVERAPQCVVIDLERV
jgi:uncharacterized protein (DUF2249 family)